MEHLLIEEEEEEEGEEEEEENRKQSPTVSSNRQLALCFQVKRWNIDRLRSMVLD